MGNSVQIPSNSPTAEFILTVTYCADPLYDSGVIKLCQKINQLFPKTVNFNVIKDDFVTGRFEVTILPNRAATRGKGILIHSKINGDGFPEQNWAAFIEKL